MTSLRRLLRYMTHETPTLVVAYIAVLVLGATTAFYAFLAGPALKFVFSGEIHDILRTADGQLRSVWHYVPTSWIAATEGLDRLGALLLMPALIVATSVVKGVAQTTQFYLLGRTSQRVLTRVREDAFGALLRQPPSFYATRAHGDLLSRLTSDANIVEQAIFNGAAPLLREPMAVLFLVGFCFVTDAKLALWTFVIVPLAVLPLARFARWLKGVSRRGQSFQGAINAVGYEALAGVGVVQAFGAEAYEQGRMAEAGKR
ncbi:MAG: ABC transporter transmembrane domain-containing protein [Myxococcota bacterium]